MLRYVLLFLLLLARVVVFQILLKKTPPVPGFFVGGLRVGKETINEM